MYQDDKRYLLTRTLAGSIDSVFDEEGGLRPSAFASFYFDRCTNDGKTAVFSLHEDAESWHPDVLDICARGNLKPGPDSEYFPGDALPFDVITVRRGVSGVVLGDFAVLEGGRDIALNWRTLYSQFFAAERMFQRCLQGKV